MNSNLVTHSSSLLTLATVVVISSILPAHAESANFTAVDEANFVTKQPEQINTISLRITIYMQSCHVLKLRLKGNHIQPG